MSDWSFELNNVKTSLIEWRSKKRLRNDSIPEELLKRIGKLTQFYSHKILRKELKISIETLRSKKMQLHLPQENDKNSNLKPRFIEVNSPLISSESRTKVHFQRSDGISMMMEISSFEAKEMLSLFLGGEICSN